MENPPIAAGASPRWRRFRNSEFPALLVLVLLTVGFFWKLVLTNQYTWMEGNDISRQVLPWFQMQVGELQAHRLPLWDPYVFGGQPLIGQTQPGVAYPLNWLLFALPTHHGYMRQGYLHWYFVIIHFIAAAAAYLLCRDIKASRGASILGACVYAFGAYMNQIDWPQMLHPASIAPLVVLFVVRTATGRRPWGSAALGGACLGFTFLGGHHQAPTFLAAMVCALWVWMVFRNGRLNRAAAAQFLLFLTMACLVSGLQLLPAYEYSQNAYRWVGAPNPAAHNDPVPYSVHGFYSLRPLGMLGILLPGIGDHTTAYIGVTAVALALLGWAIGWSRIEVRLAAAIALGGLLLALGGDVVFHGVLYALLPMFGKARNPSMAIFVFQIGAAMLAASGVDAIARGADSRWFQRIQRGALWFAGIVWLLLMFYQYFRPAQSSVDSRGLITALAAVFVAALIHGWRSGQIGGVAAVTCLVALVVVELGNGPISNMANRAEAQHHKNLPRMSRDTEMLKAIRGLPSGSRIELNDEEVPHNFGDFHGVDVWHGYLASLLQRFYDMPFHARRTRELFGVRYYLGLKPTAGWDREVLSHADGWKIWENPRAFPRVWTVHDAKQVQSKAEVQWMMSVSDLDLRTFTFLYTRQPSLETCEGEDGAWLLRREGGMARIFVDMKCRGMVILGDNFFPGWKATVDGKPATVHEAYTSVRGVVAEKGQHMIELEYRPASVSLGALMTVLGLLGAAVIARMESTAFGRRLLRS